MTMLAYINILHSTLQDHIDREVYQKQMHKWRRIQTYIKLFKLFQALFSWSNIHTDSLSYSMRMFHAHRKLSTTKTQM